MLGGDDHTKREGEPYRACARRQPSEGLWGRVDHKAGLEATTTSSGAGGLTAYPGA